MSVTQLYMICSGQMMANGQVMPGAAAAAGNGQMSLPVGAVAGAGGGGGQAAAGGHPDKRTGIKFLI